MITLTNKKDLANSSNIILNLSNEYFDKSTLDISNKIQLIKKNLIDQYLRSFDELNIEKEEELIYSFSELSWKSWYVRDPFIDIIYYLIFIEYYQEYNGNLTVYVNSIELFEFIQHQHKENIRYIKKNNFLLSLKSIVRPCFYIYKVILSKIKYGFFQRKIQKTDVLLYAYPQDRCFNNSSSWSDPFLGDLFEDIKDMGIDIKRFVPLEPILKYEKELKKLDTEIITLISFFSFSDIFKILFKKYKLDKTIKNISNQKLLIDSVDFSLLYQRYLYHFSKSNNALIRYSFYHLFNKMINKINPKVVIYFYENQPWERSINLICNKNNIKTIGINHSMISSDMYYLYNNKVLSHEYNPSYIIANGKVQYNILKKMNHNNTIIELIGSKRHKYSDMKIDQRNKSNLNNIAIILNGEISNSKFLDIVKVLNYYSSELKKYTFHIKPPPATYYNLYKRYYEELKPSMKFNNIFCEGDLKDIFSKCEIVIYFSSTVGIEAYIENKVCLSYIPSFTYNVDLTETISNNIKYINHNNFLDTILHIKYENNKIIDVEKYFRAWDKSKFKKILDDAL